MNSEWSVRNFISGEQVDYKELDLHVDYTAKTIQV